MTFLRKIGAFVIFHFAYKLMQKKKFDKAKSLINLSEDWARKETLYTALTRAMICLGRAETEEFRVLLRRVDIYIGNACTLNEDERNYLYSFMSLLVSIHNEIFSVNIACINKKGFDYKNVSPFLLEKFPYRNENMNPH